ncbi:metallophosphoesterase [Caballeronia sp. LZ062]|uniref:metallophosphoesterase family protein n=1 Tax=unclassified Caballeronia TaxID=2646786 RepID=UPI002860C518|nr:MULTISPECIES: metallophosphoesterase [unclassified Caballeronia]MDR5856584.1 metallophosphoesterase [Caballeronia sp. LZ050]MDR5873254.1 metallophosphoesterase [Caballeronia sp. LZ062]
MLSWVHFGDLHASGDDQYESLDHLKSMIRLVNRHLSDRVNFAFLPGDNANNGTPEQYRRIADEVAHLKLPLHTIPGDHDYEPGHLDAFNAFTNAALPRSRVVHGHRCIFLDVVSAGRGGPDFRLSSRDSQWLMQELASSAHDPEPPVVFMHAYPGDVADGQALAEAFAHASVAMVDTGHTHYNELLNDGYVVYAATRSTGQIEEDDGRPGFSVAAVDGGAVSWKFHPLDAPWPFVMITRPSDRRLHRSRSAPGSADATRVRVLVSDDDVESVTGHLDGMPVAFSPSADETGIWQAVLPAAATSHGARLTVTARTADGRSGEDSISLRPTAHTEKHLEHHAALGTDAHAVEPWPDHGILGTQLGPNKNGRQW